MNNKIKAIKAGECLTVVLSDGTLLVNNNATLELFNKVRNSEDESYILELMAPELSEERKKEKEEIKFNQEIINNFQILVDTGDFEVDGNSVYMVGIKRSLPKELVKKFIDIINQEKFNIDDYKSHKNFWMWCCLNPRAEVADKLFEFLSNNAFRINKQGFFFALRNVVTLEPEKSELSKFVSNQYVKIKSWKKNPAKYAVHENEDGSYFLAGCDSEAGLLSSDKKWVGYLKDLYLELPEIEGNRYTDAHTQTFDIRIGRKVEMPYEECSYSTADCAHKGLK